MIARRQILWQVLCEKSPDGGLWNGRQVADWLSDIMSGSIGLV